MLMPQLGWAEGWKGWQPSMSRCGQGTWSGGRCKGEPAIHAEPGGWHFLRTSGDNCQFMTEMRSQAGLPSGRLSGKGCSEAGPWEPREAIRLVTATSKQ